MSSFQTSYGDSLPHFSLRHSPPIYRPCDCLNIRCVFLSCRIDLGKDNMHLTCKQPITHVLPLCPVSITTKPYNTAQLPAHCSAILHVTTSNHSADLWPCIRPRKYTTRILLKPAPADCRLPLNKYIVEVDDSQLLQVSNLKFV
jgi:hypothetical protein